MAKQVIAADIGLPCASRALSYLWERFGSQLTADELAWFAQLPEMASCTLACVAATLEEVAARADEENSDSCEAASHNTLFTLAESVRVLSDTVYVGATAASMLSRGTR